MNTQLVQATIDENTSERPQLPKSHNQSNEMIVVIRPSFMKFCQDGCRAAALNHILYWIAQKAKGQPVDLIQNGEISWYASNEEITESLMAWGGCKVRIEVNSLIDMGLLGQSRGHKWGSGNRAKHFIFSKDHCAALLDACQEQGVNILQIGLCDTVLRLIQATTTNEVLIAAIQKMLTSSKSREIQALISSHTSSEIRESHPLDLETSSSKSRGPKTKDYTKVSNKGLRSSTASESETEQNDNNDSSFSVQSSSQQSTAEEQKSNQPAFGGNGRETPHACFTDEVEQLLWGKLRDAGFAKRDKPNNQQRQDVADLAKNLKTCKFAVEWVTVELLEESFKWQASIKKFKNLNKEVGNTVTCLPDYINAGLAGWAMPVLDTPEITPQDETEGDTAQTVIWTRSPSIEVCDNPLTYIHLFKEMLVEEARRKYDYDNGTYGYLTPEEEKAIREYLAQEPVAMEG